MRNVVVSEFMSLDGVIDDPGGAEDFKHGGWAFKFDRGAEGGAFKLDELLESEVLLLGRVTYEEFAKAWPSRSGEFADKMNNMPKFVVSSTLEDADWNNSTIIRNDVVEYVSELKRQPGGTLLVCGSGMLVNLLVEHDLVDEYRLMVFPVALGSGKRLFADADEATTLRLVDARKVGPDGVQIQVFKPKRNNGASNDRST
jgi:dihydrofolate reductase